MTSRSTQVPFAVVSSALVVVLTVVVYLAHGVELAHAAPLKVTSGPILNMRHHDLSHPMKVNYPCPGMAHSGVVRVGTIPTFNCTGTTSTKSGSVPYAGNQSGYCNNGTTYLQTYNGQGKIWAAPPGTPPNTYNTAYQMTGWVEYFWCPSWLYSSGSINYAFGEEWPQGTLNGGCPIMNAGDPSAETQYDWPGPGFTWGASLKQQTTSTFWGDGEQYQQWTICPGNAVWDYSSAADGQFAYQAWMSCGSNSPPSSDSLMILWPTFQ
jgi:hypothetical protein